MASTGYDNYTFVDDNLKQLVFVCFFNMFCCQFHLIINQSFCFRIEINNFKAKATKINFPEKPRKDDPYDPYEHRKVEHPLS